MRLSFDFSVMTWEPIGMTRETDRGYLWAVGCLALCAAGCLVDTSEYHSHPGYVVDRHRAVLALDVEPGLLDSATEAAELIYEATGCTVEFAEYGARVYLDDFGAGSGLLGQGRLHHDGYLPGEFKVESIRISETLPEEHVGSVLLHEMVHAFWVIDHIAESPLMRAVPLEMVVDQLVIDAIKRSVDCL